MRDVFVKKIKNTGVAWPQTSSANRKDLFMEGDSIVQGLRRNTYAKREKEFARSEDNAIVILDRDLLHQHYNVKMTKSSFIPWQDGAEYHYISVFNTKYSFLK